MVINTSFKKEKVKPVDDGRFPKAWKCERKKRERMMEIEMEEGDGMSRKWKELRCA